MINAEDCIVLKAKVENNCYWESGHQVIQQSSYFLNRTNSCVKAASMYFDGAVIQLYSNSIFFCEGRATLTSYTSSISAIGKDPALFQTDEFILLGNNSVGLYGDLYI